MCEAVFVFSGVDTTWETLQSRLPHGQEAQCDHNSSEDCSLEELQTSPERVGTAQMSSIFYFFFPLWAMYPSPSLIPLPIAMKASINHF